MSAEPAIVTRFRQSLDGRTDEELEALGYNSPAVHFSLFMEIKDKNGMDSPISEVPDNPFSLETLPKTFPPPESLTFSPFHTRKASKTYQSDASNLP